MVSVGSSERRKRRMRNFFMGGTAIIIGVAESKR
jgi:hypothetical protein